MIWVICEFIAYEFCWVLGVLHMYLCQTAFCLPSLLSLSLPHGNRTTLENRLAPTQGKWVNKREVAWQQSPLRGLCGHLLRLIRRSPHHRGDWKVIKGQELLSSGVFNHFHQLRLRKAAAGA